MNIKQTEQDEQQCISAEQIDCALLLQLVDKLTVGQKTKVSGEPYQQITVSCNFVGAVE